MFKLVVLSAFVAVAVAAPKPQVHQSSLSYSSPVGGHSSTFVASGSPAGSALSSSSSSSLLHGDFVANTAHALATPAIAYGAPGFQTFTQTLPVVSSYSSGFASSHGNQFSTPSGYIAHDFQNEFNNGQFFQNGQAFGNGQGFQNGHEFQNGYDSQNGYDFQNGQNFQNGQDFQNGPDFHEEHNGRTLY